MPAASPPTLSAARASWVRTSAKTPRCRPTAFRSPDIQPPRAMTAKRRLQPSASRKQRRFANGAAHEPNRPEGAFACSKYQADRGKAHAFRVGSAAWRDWPANFHVLFADGAVAWGRAHRSGRRPRNCLPRDAAARLLMGALGHRQTEASPYVGFCHSAARPSPPWFEAGRVDWIPTSPGATRRAVSQRRWRIS